MKPQLLGTTLEGSEYRPASRAPETPGERTDLVYGLNGLAAVVAEHGHDWKLRSGTMEMLDDGVIGDVRHRVTVTQIVPTTSGSLIHADYRVVTSEDSTVERGTAVFTAPSEYLTDAAPELRFSTPEWGKAILPWLEASTEFSAAVQAYDGTIGIAGNGGEVHFRIYKGKVIDVGRRALKGADFTISASGTTWCQLILGARNDFMDRALKGEFSTTGSGYEYLRMTKALVLIIDAARAAASTNEKIAK